MKNYFDQGSKTWRMFNDHGCSKIKDIQRSSMYCKKIKEDQRSRRIKDQGGSKIKDDQRSRMFKDQG